MIKKTLTYIAVVLFFSVALFSIHLLKEFLSIPKVDEKPSYALLSNTTVTTTTHNILVDDEKRETLMASGSVPFKVDLLEKKQRCLQEGNNEFVPEGSSCKSSLGIIVSCQNGLVRVGHSLEGKKLEISNIIFQCYKHLE